MRRKSTSRGEILIYGASGHAKVVIDIVERTRRYAVAFLVDDDPQLKGRQFFGYRVLGARKDLEAWRARHRPIGGIVAIGDNGARARVAAWLAEHGFRAASALHPAAAIGSGVEIGGGTAVMAGAVINAEARIGTHVIVNTGCTIDHDCAIGDFVHIAPGSHLCGGVSVGSGTLLGAGTTVVPGVRIGSNVLVGAGSTVLEDIPDGARMAGSPCRPVAS